MEPIAESSRRTPYQPTTPTTVFPVGFPLFDNDDLRVTLNGEPFTAFTVSGTYINGISDDAAINVTGGGVIGDLVIDGFRLPRRTDLYKNGAALKIDDHNYSLNRVEATMQELRRDTDDTAERLGGLIGEVTDLAERAEAAAEQAESSASSASGFNDSAQDAANRAEDAASGVNLPSIGLGNAGDLLTVKSDGSGYETISRATKALAERPSLPSYPESNAIMTVARTMDMIRARRPGIYVKDYGALGDNSGQAVSDWIGAGKPYATLSALQADYPDVSSTSDTKDWAAFAKAIRVANAQSIPSFIVAEPGYYQLNRALPNISSNTIVEGCGPRSTILVFGSGSYDAIKYIGNDNVARLGQAGIRNIGIFSSALTDGFTFVLDQCQSFHMQNVMVDSPYNFCFVRQCGSTYISDVDIQPIRGLWGIRAIGTNASRNGGIDKIDVINVTNSILHGTTKPGVTAGTANLIHVDGYVHTLQLNSVLLLAGARGLLFTNDGGLAQPYRPSFVFANDVEIENPQFEALKADALIGGYFTNCFFVGSQTESGIVLEAAVTRVKFSNCDIHGHYKSGVRLRGCQFIDFFGADIFYNSRADANAFSGIDAGDVGGANSALFTVHGGLAGKEITRPTYTEWQKFGISVESGAARTYGLTTSGNSSGATYANPTYGSIVAV